MPKVVNQLLGVLLSFLAVLFARQCHWRQWSERRQRSEREWSSIERGVSGASTGELLYLKTIFCMAGDNIREDKKVDRLLVGC